MLNYRFLFVFLLLLGFSAHAQKKSKSDYFAARSYQYPIYKWAGDYKRNGIQVNFGPTYLMTRSKTDLQPLSVSSDTSYAHKPNGRFGGFAEIGMVHIAKTRKKIHHYIDWGVGYKHFSGSEITYIQEERLGVVVESEGKGLFSLGYLYGRINIHNIYQQGRSRFFDNALGLNIDYRIAGANRGDNSRYDMPFIPSTQTFQQNLVVQLNYDFGYGFKVRDGFFVIPGIHIPIIGLHEWNGGKPAIQWYSSNYQPVLAKLKLVWLFKKEKEGCPAVYGNEEDAKRNRQYLEQQ
jgi:hypothetical protein